MRNNIASFEKTSRSRVKIMEKINAEFISAFCSKYNLTMASFLKITILFLIYLLADKAKCLLYFHDTLHKSTYVLYVSICI